MINSGNVQRVATKGRDCFNPPMVRARRTFTVSLISLAMISLLLSPINAFACACCAEPGHYFTGETDLDEYPLSQLKRMRFMKTALLYLTEADLEEDAFGINNPKESYSIQGAFVANLWRLTFRSGANTGTLDLPLPSKMWSHSADIHDGKISGGGGPLLYKEWRLEGNVKGSGIFKNGTSSPAKYMFVLQGRGNGCDNSEDFKNWHLEVRGEKARFEFYGRFGKPAP
jgi:hypothetical protein